MHSRTADALDLARVGGLLVDSNSQLCGQVKEAEGLAQLFHVRIELTDAALEIARQAHEDAWADHAEDVLNVADDAFVVDDAAIGADVRDGGIDLIGPIGGDEERRHQVLPFLEIALVQQAACREVTPRHVEVVVQRLTELHLGEISYPSPMM